MDASQHAHDISAYWWLHPGKLILFFVIPIYLFIAFLMREMSPDLIVLRSRNYLEGNLAVAGASCLFVMAGACFLGAKLDVSRGPGATPYVVNERFLLWCALIVLTAYAIWFWPMVARLQLQMGRDELNRMPGVTSFAQLGVPFVVCFLYAKWRAEQPLPRLLHWLFFLVLLLTVVRVYVWGERLALVEVAVPATLSMLAYYRPRRPIVRGSLKLLGKYGPFLGVPALLGFFTATEMFRSWESYSEHQSLNLGEFMVSRLVTYYYTALNNGAGLLATSVWPNYDFVFILEWVYRLPFGIGEFLWSTLGRRDIPANIFLERFGDPEFNNMSGIYPILYDAGYIGGVLYFFVFGLVAGTMYRGMRKGTRLGIVLYPSLLVACLEVMRVGYLNGTRAFLVVVGALLAATQLRSAARPGDAAGFAVVRTVHVEPLA